jgi:hypothetical protein
VSALAVVQTGQQIANLGSQQKRHNPHSAADDLLLIIVAGFAHAAFVHDQQSDRGIYKSGVKQKRANVVKNNTVVTL